MASKREKTNLNNSVTFWTPNLPQAPWMDTKSLFSPPTTLEKKLQETKAARKRAGLDHGSGTSSSGNRLRVKSQHEKTQILREAIVKFVCQPEEDSDSSPCGSSKLTAEEKCQKKYEYYIQYGIDLENVAPLEDSWQEHIRNLIPDHLLFQRTAVEQLVEEIKEEYLHSVKTAILRFTFRYSEEDTEDKTKHLPPHRLEVEKVPKPWNKTFIQAQKGMKLKLHCINPTMKKLLFLWDDCYKNLRLINVEEFHGREESMELSVFQQIVSRQVDHARGILLREWIPKVQNIYNQGCRKKLVPSPNNTSQLLSFFNCAAALMTLQLQGLAVQSMKEYTDLISQDTRSERVYEHPGFVLHLILEENEIKFEPILKVYEEALVNVYEFMLRSLSGIPRLETKIFSDLPASKFDSSLKPIILPEILQTQQKEVHRVFSAESVKSTEYIHDKYSSLLTKLAEEDVEQFLSKQHTFQEIMEAMIHYQQLAKEIQYTSCKVVRVGMFEIQSHKLTHSLVKRAQELEQKLITRMLRDHQELNKKLCNEFEMIAAKALSTPPDTQKLMELQVFMNKVETTEMPLLQQRLADSISQLCSLTNYVILSPSHIELNAQTVQWFKRMPSIFKKHQKIIAEKTEQYQSLLKLRLDGFVEELESYSVLVQVFATFGDLNELSKYLEKAQALNATLESAMEKINDLNLEEESYGWPVTHYPQCKKIQDKLTPYLCLYETATDYLNKYEQWLHEPLSGVNPDQVEGDVEIFWQTLYELEEGFNDVPQALHLASTMKSKVEDFKEQIPLLQVLCNPGLRDHHWESMSEVAGTSLQPAGDQVCVADFLSFNLDQHLSSFKAISEAASKENSLTVNPNSTAE